MTFLRAVSLVAGTLALAGCGTSIRALSELAGAAADAADPISAIYHLRNTRLGLELKAHQRESGTVYYAVYDADPGTLTASAVKAAATGALAGSLVANGTLAAAANADALGTVTGLAEKKLYTFFAVAEGASGLDTDAHVKKYAGVLPKSMTQLNFNKVTGPSAGTLVRYAAAVPQDYYDNPSKNYPILIWLHGNGESSNDGANAESNFTSLAGFMGPFKRLDNDLYGIPMIVIAAQCNYAFFSCANQADYTLHKEAYDDAITRFRTDPKRVYVSGISYGGQGAITFAHQYPTLVSAAVPVATNESVTAASLCTTVGANNVAMWVINNENDSVFGHASIENMVSNLRGCASYTNPLAKPRITVLPQNSAFPNTIEGHGSVENLSFELPLYWAGAWQYWNGAAQVNDTVPPTHPNALHPIFSSATPGNTPAPTAIVQDSFVTVGADHGATVTSLYDYMLLFSKP